MKEKLAAYSDLVRLNRPIGIFLLLWPTLWALFLSAEGKPDFTILTVFALGVVLMRSAGCAINDFADRKYDGDVSRTKHRPIITGKVSALEAIFIFIALSIAAFLLVVFFLNTLTLQISLVAVVLAATYPFTKRLHYLPQVHLGVAFAWAIPMAFVAQTGQFPPPWGWLLFIITILWTTAYDTMYGMIDRKDDIKIGIKSTAILFGSADRLIIGILQVFVLLGLISVGVQTELRYWFFCSIGLVALFFIYQQILINHRHPRDCLEAFLNNNYVGMIIFIGIIASYWLPI